VTLPPFQRLVDEHWYAVGRLAHALAGPTDGDDVAQQAWTQALAAYPTLRTADNLRGWLLTITARCATDLHRARVRRAVPVGALPDDVPAGGPPPGGGNGRAPEPADDDLWSAVRSLPERQRTALALRYVADLDHATIARSLATTPAATRRLVSDALSTLRRLVPADPEPPTDLPRENR
jgi:RNA polymerase sigma factor (sigma-70 family)